MKKWGKIIVKGIVIFMCLVLVGRVLYSEIEFHKDFVPTAAASEVYKKTGELKVLTNKVEDEISEEGYFSAYGMHYIPDTGELQVTVRYNKSTVDKLGKVDFCVYIVDTSVDPVDMDEIVTEEIGDIKYHEGYPVENEISPSYRKKYEKPFYYFERLVFEGITIEESTNVIIAIYPKDDPDKVSGTLSVHFAEQYERMKTYKLSKSDKKSLEAFE